MNKVFGGILLGTGILIMTLTGLCSIYVSAIGITGIANPNEFLSGLLLIGAFGGIPFLIGLGIMLWGRGILRRAKADEPE